MEKPAEVVENFSDETPTPVENVSAEVVPEIFEKTPVENSEIESNEIEKENSPVKTDFSHRLDQFRQKISEEV